MNSIRDFPLFDGDFFPDHLRTLLAPPTPKGRGPPGLCREESSALASQLKKKTHAMRKRFLVARLQPDGGGAGGGTRGVRRGARGAAASSSSGGGGEGADEREETPYNELVDKRGDLLGLCQKRHWQFDELRRAHFSTMMMIAAIGGAPSS